MLYDWVKKLEGLTFGKPWTYASGLEDIVERRTDCSGFAHISGNYLGFNVPRLDTGTMYQHKHARSEYAVPSIVVIPGHCGVLLAPDFVVECYRAPEGSNAVRTVSLRDWLRFNAVVAPAKFLPLKAFNA